MIKFKCMKVIFLIFQLIFSTSASTHWVVTENGRIQSHLDSPFDMRKPFDLMAFLGQDTRRTEIETLYTSLVTRKQQIDDKWSILKGATEIESRLYGHSDCTKAFELFDEIDLYTSIAVDGSDRDGVRMADYMIENFKEAEIVPECHKVIKLDFSMFTFEHLAAMTNRANLTMSPEQGLGQWFKPGTTVATFGHQIAIGLAKNKTSWIHYNLGTIYWRIKGDAFKAIECGRRAVYYAPREYRDIPLLNLASIFHQARHPGEAAIILHAAVDHAPLQPVNHFALGNVYAILADYNRSIACFENCLKLRPTLGQAVIFKQALVCFRKIEYGLLELNDALQGMLTEVLDYHMQRERWYKLQEQSLNEQAPMETKLLNLPDSLNQVLLSRGQTCSERGEDSKLSCEANKESPMLSQNFQMDTTLSLQYLLRNVEIQAQKISEQMTKNLKLLSSSLSSKEPLKTESFLSSVKEKEEEEASGDGFSHTIPTEKARYPAAITLSAENVEFDDHNWPSKQQCTKWRNINDEKLKKVEVFLSPENKGFPVSSILSTLIDIPLTIEHSLPWYPPVCTVDPELEKKIDTTYFPSQLVKQSSNANAGIIDPSLRNHFMQYINNGISVEAEIGQRILTAMNKKIGPEWLLATMSSLYWRTRSNKRNAIECLKIALLKVPDQYRDVPLISLASIMFELGFIDEAFHTAGEAFTVNKIEPATNFLLALLHDAKDNIFGAIYHIKQTLRVDAGFRNGDADQLLKLWACKNKLEGSEDKDPLTKDQQCSEKDGGSIKSEGVVCSANGEQCKTASIQCYRAEKIVEDGDLMTFESIPLSNLLGNNENCQGKKGVKTLYTALLPAKKKDADGVHKVLTEEEIMESQVLYENAIQMRLALEAEREEQLANANQAENFYVSLTDDPTPKVLLHVYDRSGTYQLSPGSCKEIKDADWLSFTSMWWHSVADRNIELPVLKPLADKKQEPKVPFCDKNFPTPPQVAEHLPSLTARKYIHAPEPKLSDWLALMTGDPKSTMRDLGTRIAIALNENATSWMLATAAAIYWRVLGNTAQAITCLKQALHYAPEQDKDIPMINLANVLQRIGLLTDALEIAKMALEVHPDYVVNQFTAGNIYTALGDFEKAITFYRTSLTLDPSFDAARNRLQAILCTLLFDESGSLRDTERIYKEKHHFL